MKTALITTVPFASANELPIEILQNADVEYLINPLDRKLTEAELIDMVPGFNSIIAGTEPITAAVMDACPTLEHISRVGVGLDSVDLQAARERGIRVSYTPEAPAPAVAELTIALMLALLRSVHISNNEMHREEWRRIFGRRLAEVTIGVIGLGRIGTRVLNRTKGFGTPRILANDIEPNYELSRQFKLEWASKDKLLQESDIVTLHVPLTRRTNNLITKSDLLMMKEDAFIVNTSRGGVINEQDLFDVMAAGHLGGAAIDVFEQEPYSGPLSKIERCILTSHMGSMSIDCRTRMEIEATREAVRYLSGYSLESSVPEEEYEAQAMFRSVDNA